MSTSTSNGTIRIPILPHDVPPTKEYVRELEIAIEADGCTGVSEIYHCCCVIHDLGYRFHIDVHGNPVDRDDVDENFKICMQEHSFLGKFSLMSWWRWLGVRWLGDNHYTIFPKLFETYIFNKRIN